MVDFARSLLTVGTIFLAAFGLGRPLLRRLSITLEGRLELCVWSVSLGLLAAGEALLLMRLCGCLGPAAIALLTVGGAFWGVGELLCTHHEWRSAYDAGRLRRKIWLQSDDEERPSAVYRLVPRALVAVVLVGSVVQVARVGNGAALTPALSQWERGQIAVVQQETHDNAMHGRGEMWTDWARALDGRLSTGLVQWAFGLLLAGATVLLARPLVGVGWSGLAGVIALLTPAVNQQMFVPTGELASAWWAALAVLAWSRAAAEVEAQRWFILAGLAAGAAAALHAPAALLPLAAAVVSLVVTWAQPEQRWRLMRGATTVFVLAGCVAVPWHFGAMRETEVRAHANSNLVGLQHLGPLLLALLPALLVVRRLRGLNVLVATAALYGTLALLLMAGGQWWCPIIPLLSVAAAWSAVELSRLPLAVRAFTEPALVGLAIALSLGPMRP